MSGAKIQSMAISCKVYMYRTITTVQALCFLCSNVHNIVIYVQVTWRSHAGHMQVTCRSHVCHMQVTCLSHAGHMYVTCRSHVCCVGSRGNAVWIPLHLLFSQGSPGCFYLLPQKAVTPVKLAKNGDMRIFWKVLGSFMSRLSPLGSSLHLLESNCAGNRQGEEVRTYTSTCIE